MNMVLPTEEDGLPLPKEKNIQASDPTDTNPGIEPQLPTQKPTIL
jgi:hypothetical protein